MSVKALEELRQAYPGRYALKAEEVALVLRGKNSRGVAQGIREGMKNGRYPGARKIDNIWQLPLSDLADVLDPPREAPTLPRASGGPTGSRTGRRRSAIGPRLELIRAMDFWAQVFQAMGEGDMAQELALTSAELREEGNSMRNIARAHEVAQKLAGATPAATGPDRRRGMGPSDGEH